MANPAVLVFGGIAIGVTFTVITTLVILPSITETVIRRKGPRILASVIPGGFITETAATPIANTLAVIARDGVKEAVTPW